jgi:hypothetical protein
MLGVLVRNVNWTPKKLFKPQPTVYCICCAIEHDLFVYLMNFGDSTRLKWTLKESFRCHIEEFAAYKLSS